MSNDWAKTNDAEAKAALGRTGSVDICVVSLSEIEARAEAVIKDGEPMSATLSLACQAIDKAAHDDEWPCCVCSEEYDITIAPLAIVVVAGERGATAGMVCAACWDAGPEAVTRSVLDNLDLATVQ
jgi:hypothetical protein